MCLTPGCVVVRQATCRPSLLWSSTAPRNASGTRLHKLSSKRDVLALGVSPTARTYSTSRSHLPSTWLLSGNYNHICNAAAVTTVRHPLTRQGIAATVPAGHNSLICHAGMDAAAGATTDAVLPAVHAHVVHVHEGGIMNPQGDVAEAATPSAAAQCLESVEHASPSFGSGGPGRHALTLEVELLWLGSLLVGYAAATVLALCARGLQRLPVTLEREWDESSWARSLPHHFHNLEEELGKVAEAARSPMVKQQEAAEVGSGRERLLVGALKDMAGEADRVAHQVRMASKRQLYGIWEVMRDHISNIARAVDTSGPDSWADARSRVVPMQGPRSLSTPPPTTGPAGPALAPSPGPGALRDDPYEEARWRSGIYEQMDNWGPQTILHKDTHGVGLDSLPNTDNSHGVVSGSMPNMDTVPGVTSNSMPRDVGPYGDDQGQTGEVSLCGWGEGVSANVDNYPSGNWGSKEWPCKVPVGDRTPVLEPGVGRRRAFVMAATQGPEGPPAPAAPTEATATTQPVGHEPTATEALGTLTSGPDHTTAATTKISPPGVPAGATVGTMAGTVTGMIAGNTAGTTAEATYGTPAAAAGVPAERAAAAARHGEPGVPSMAAAERGIEEDTVGMAVETMQEAASATTHAAAEDILAGEGAGKAEDSRADLAAMAAAIGSTAAGGGELGAATVGMDEGDVNKGVTPATTLVTGAAGGHEGDKAINTSASDDVDWNDNSLLASAAGLLPRVQGTEDRVHIMGENNVPLCEVLRVVREGLRHQQEAGWRDDELGIEEDVGGDLYAYWVVLKMTNRDCVQGVAFVSTPVLGGEEALASGRIPPIPA